jgi:hypothetical protein
VRHVGWNRQALRRCAFSHRLTRVVAESSEVALGDREPGLTMLTKRSIAAASDLSDASTPSSAPLPVEYAVAPAIKWRETPDQIRTMRPALDRARCGSASRTVAPALDVRAEGARLGRTVGVGKWDSRVDRPADALATRRREPSERRRDFAQARLDRLRLGEIERERQRLTPAVPKSRQRSLGCRCIVRVDDGDACSLPRCTRSRLGPPPRPARRPDPRVPPEAGQE